MKNIDEIINITDELVKVQTDNSFKSLEKVILKASLSQEKKTYAQIAHEYNYAESYIKHIVAPKLWKLLSRLLGEKINRSNCQAKLIKLIANQKQTEHQSTIIVTLTDLISDSTVVISAIA